MYFRLDNNRFKYVNFLNLFDVVKIKDSIHKTQDGFSEGDYPILGANRYYERLLDKATYLDTYDYENLYTINDFGFMFYIPYKFNINQHIIVLRKITNIDDLNLLLISIQLSSIFSFSKSIGINKLKNINVWIYE